MGGEPIPTEHLSHVLRTGIWI